MPHGMHTLNAQHRMICIGCCASDVFHMDVLHRMHCIGYNDNDNAAIRYYNKKFNVYNENKLPNMLILKVKLKANINLAFKNSGKTSSNYIALHHTLS